MDPQITLLLSLLDEGFDRKAWHGPNLRGSIRGLTADQAAWRPDKRRHNIWEIVIHAAYWKYAVRRRLLNEPRGSFPLKGSNWFVRPVAGDEAEWKKDVRFLQEQHEALRKAIEGLTPHDLTTKPAGSRVTTDRIVYGIAAHDIYHAGQIQLLKRLQQKGK